MRIVRILVENYSPRVLWLIGMMFVRERDAMIIWCNKCVCVCLCVVVVDKQGDVCLFF